MANEYSLTVVLEKMYENQLGLEAALMELVLLVEQQGYEAVGKMLAWHLNESERMRGLSIRAWHD